MAKIMLTVSVPAIGTAYDLRLPANIVVRELIPLIVNAIVELSAGTYRPSGSEILCHEQFCARVSSRQTLDDNGVRSGDRLFLL